VFLRSLASLILLALLPACRSTLPPRKARPGNPAALGPQHPYPVASPRKAADRLVTPVVRIPVH